LIEEYKEAHRSPDFTKSVASSLLIAGQDENVKDSSLGQFIDIDIAEVELNVYKNSSSSTDIAGH
jgi:hypothetical protein